MQASTDRRVREAGASSAELMEPGYISLRRCHIFLCCRFKQCSGALMEVELLDWFEKGFSVSYRQRYDICGCLLWT